MAVAVTRRAMFARRLRARESVSGLFVRTPRHEIIELLGGTALDFVVLDAEHAPFDRAALDVCLLAAVAVDLPTLVRVPGVGSELCLAALDLGADGLLVPHIDDPAMARAAARTARYGDPSGRGLSLSTRAAAYGRRSFREHMATANADCLVICQIETPAAVAAAAGIAAEDGVDGLFFGRVDLAATSGGAGLDHPSQEAAAAATLGAARAAAKPVGLIVGGAHDAAMAKAAGATMFVLGTEHALLTRQIASQLDELSQSRGTT